jgi:hypothetical protein
VNVSKNEPKARVSPVKDADKTISKESRRRASALTSAISARGLSEKDRKRASSKDDPDYQSLEKLEEETKSIPDERVEKFNKTAK